jgi:hypothetical protein
VAGMAPILLASAGISIAVLILFVATLLQAIGLPSGTGGKIRLLQFLSPADLAVGTAMIVAVGLVELFRVQMARRGGSSSGASQQADLIQASNVMAIAAIVAAALSVAAVVRAIVELTVSGRSGSLRTGNFLDAIAGALVAAAAAWWGLKTQD